MNLTSLFINILFPPRCVGCKKSGAYICDSCLANIESLSLSPRAGEPFYSLYYYKNPPVQKSIFLAKYKGVFRALYPFAKPIAQTIFEIEKKSEAYQRPFILIPLPSTKKSVRKRGFSQTEVIAQQIAKLYPKDFEVAPILFRSRKNKKQTECASRAERISNMKDVFAIKQNTTILPGAVYVLLDDVITTGATMRAAQQALTEGGARTVLGISIAYQELS